MPLRQILRIAIQQGARLAQPESLQNVHFKRKDDLAQAEGVMDLICAKTESGQRLPYSIWKDPLIQNS